MARSSKHRKGFLLVESLLAATLLTVGVVACWEAFAAAKEALHRADGDNAMADCLQRDFVEATVNGREMVSHCHE